MFYHNYGHGLNMKTSLLFTLLTIVITLYSCEKKCSCESVIYESTFEKDMPKVAMIAYDILALLIATEKDKKTININDLINKEGFLGLRGLFRLSNNGTVERSFDLKNIKNKKFIVYEKANNFF